LDTHGIVLADPVYSRLETAWREVRTDLEREAWIEATGRLSYLVELRTDLGVRNLPEFASVLMHAAEDAAANGATDAAAALADTAAVLAPELVSARLAVAHHHFQSAPLGLTGTIRSLRNAVELLEDDLPAYMALIGNTAVIWIDLVIILSLLLAVAMYVRYSRFASSDLRRALPKGVTLVQAELLLLAALVTPFALGLGLLVTVVVWLVVFASYLRPTERVAALVMVLAIASTPAATRSVVRALTFTSQTASVLHRCDMGLCSSDDRKLIRGWAHDEVSPYESHFVTALTLTRDAGAKGDWDSYEVALRHATTALDLRQTTEAYTLLGNLAYMRGLRQCSALEGEDKAAGAKHRIERAQRDAVDYWTKALSLRPGYVPALYNSSITLTQLGEHKGADPLLERAMRLQHEEILYWNKTVSRDGSNLVACKLGVYANRQVMLPALPRNRLRYRVTRATVPHDGLLVPFSGVVTGRLGTGFLGLAGLAGAAALVLLWLLAKALRPTGTCTVCGNVAVPGNRLETRDGPVCGECVQDDVRRAFVDAKKKWFREQRLGAIAIRRARLARLVTWVLPGYGHLIRGKPLRGLVFLGVTMGFLAAGTDLHRIIDDPHAPLGTGLPAAVAMAIPAAIAYLLAIIDAHAGGGRP